jgi:hypothetical protein
MKKEIPISCSMWVLLSIYGHAPQRAAIAAGLLLAVCVSISQPCALVAALAASGRVVSSLSVRRYQTLSDLVLMAVSSMIVAGGSYGLLSLIHSGAIQQYRLASDLILARKFWDAVTVTAIPYWVWSQHTVAPLFMGLAILTAIYCSDRLRWIGAWGGACGGMLFLFITSSWQTDYTWFCAPYLLINLAALWATSSRTERRIGAAATAAIALMALTTVANFASLQRHAFLARPEINTQGLQTFLQDMLPSGSVVVTNDSHVWFSVASRCRIWEPWSLPTPEQTADITHIIWTRLRTTNLKEITAALPLWIRDEVSSGRFHFTNAPEPVAGFRGRNFIVLEAKKTSTQPLR